MIWRSLSRDLRFSILPDESFSASPHGSDADLSGGDVSVFSLMNRSQLPKVTLGIADDWQCFSILPDESFSASGRCGIAILRWQPVSVFSLMNRSQLLGARLTLGVPDDCFSILPDESFSASARNARRAAAHKVSVFSLMNRSQLPVRNEKRRWNYVEFQYSP